MHSQLSHLLWRTFGGVIGVSALIGLAVSIGWMTRHFGWTPGA